MRKKIAIISLYADDVKGIPPLAPLYLATALKKNGYSVKIIHKNIKDVGRIITEIENYHPNLVGMSVFTGYNNKEYIQLSQKLKNKGYKIVWGNAHPSLLPEQTLREKCIDFIVIGEGEETLVDLMENLDNPEKYYFIKGIGFKDKYGKTVINKRRPFINLDDYLIDWSLIDIRDYLVPYFSNRYKQVLTVTTSRGCPFNCQFCYNLVFNRRTWRAHSAESVIGNLKPIIKEHKIDAIRFLDDNFFVDKERAFEIARGLGLPYFAESRVEFVDEEFVKNLKDTKCQEIMFGFESGSNRIMKDVVKKGTGTKEVINAVKLLKDSGIMVSGSIVFGFPTETNEEYKKTMGFIVDLLEINNNLAFTSGWFLPYPGTGLYEKAKELGFNPPDKTEGWDRFDRWRNDYEMEWINWDYKLPVKYSRRIIHLLAMSYKRNIPILKNILKWRVKNLNFFLPIDIYIFGKLRNIYLFRGDKNFVYRIIRRGVRKIIRIRNV